MGVCETINSKKNHFKSELNQQIQTRRLSPTKKFSKKR